MAFYIFVAVGLDTADLCQKARCKISSVRRVSAMNGTSCLGGLMMLASCDCSKPPAHLAIGNRKTRRTSFS